MIDNGTKEESVHSTITFKPLRKWPVIHINIIPGNPWRCPISIGKVTGRYLRIRCYPMGIVLAYVVDQEKSWTML